jgi:hypothetical protein
LGVVKIPENIYTVPFLRGQGKSACRPAEKDFEKARLIGIILGLNGMNLRQGDRGGDPAGGCMTL